LTIVKVKIHPAIGIARVGNSPDEFFIGPEHPGDRSIPPDGYKDDKCRVKRQAAQFHIFAYHKDGSTNEITSEQAEIKWTVHLANKKASVNDRNPPKPGKKKDSKKLIINPGPRTLTGPDQREIFDSGKIKFSGFPLIVVPLGEIRTDKSCRLLVFGGFGKSDSPSKPIDLPSFYDNHDWYDDTSDGPVNATIKIRSTGEAFEAEGAWVIVGPPKFAPGIDNIITMYDRLFDLGRAKGWAELAATTSYTRHIYPTLERARNIRWVYNPRGAHSWSHPVVDPTVRHTIFARLTAPDDTDADMPRLQELGMGQGRLTKTQYQYMQNWRDGLFTNDWTGPPLPESKFTPQGLDESALENAVGGAFYPGIEAGGITKRPILDLANYTSLFRLDSSKVFAGDLTAYMALPWQADFKSCGFNPDPPPDSTWWPIPRPNMVIPEGEANYQVWDRYVGTREEMSLKWDTLGFVVRKGNEYVEVDKCHVPSITLLTPHITFSDIPQGPLGMSSKVSMPIIFEVKSIGGPITLEFQSEPLHARLRYFKPSVSVGPTIGSEVATAKLWLSYETGVVGEVINDIVVIRNPVDNKSWAIAITANTVGRKRTAIALVLDRSSRMSDDRGDGEIKHKSLQEACRVFVDNMLEGDGVAIVRFNENADVLQEVTLAGSPRDSSRTKFNKNTLFSQLHPSGDPVIENGIYEGQKALEAAGHDFKKTLLVLTGANENRKHSMVDVASNVNKQTYAIGFGRAENTNVPLLQPLCANNGGYMLVTGNISGDKYFLLQKYFLQILAAVKNSEIVKDHQSELMHGEKQGIPFYFTEADRGMDVILLTRYPQHIDFHLRSPSGFTIGPQKNEPKIHYAASSSLSYYRIILPVELERGRFDQGGTWNAILLGKSLKRELNHESKPKGISKNEFNTRRQLESIHISGAIPYSLLIHSYSDLSFRTWLRQEGYETGDYVYLDAILLQSGAPLATSGSVRAEVTKPDGSSTSFVLKENEEGQFSGAFSTTIPGVYHVRIKSSGQSNLGYPFQREQNLSAAVWHSGGSDALYPHAPLESLPNKLQDKK
jgi:hypothetical protein